MNVGKKDEDSEVGLFHHIDKSTVLQEARAFNETPINPRKCRLILTKLAYLLYQSEVFHTKEATETFFSITKLFQSPDVGLRQMVYLLIKELSTIAEDVYFMTSSVMRDMNAKSDVIYRANAIRALAKITDSSTFPAIERFVKQAIVDKNPSVSSAALVSALHLFSTNKDVVRRWASEVQEAINSKQAATQYHALALMYQIRQHDRMAVTKIVQTYAPVVMRSQLSYCMLIRYTAKIMEDEEPGTRTFDPLLQGWLQHRNDMVVYEAARAICNLPNVTDKELRPAVTALNVMLLSHKPTLRFAAIRTLNKLAMTNPVAVSLCNVDMENLISDSNRSIATFAITTLLKTGTEQSVDRLMKQISGFMNEISDEFKIIVIDAVRSLSLKFPAKQASMLNFLSNVLRDEGGYEYKRAIVEAIFDIIYHIPESKEFALSHLCEFIEDCEFTKLAVRILHLLGTEGPRASKPSKYIRYIYNRVILENSTVRAAAVGALAQFAVQLPDLKERIRTLLTRCTEDTEDEVRDRAIMYLRLMDDEELARKYIVNDVTYSWPTLERNLVTYLAQEAAHTQEFDISSTPIVTKAQEAAEKSRAALAATESATTASSSGTSAAAGGASSRGPQTTVADTQAGYAAAMEALPQLAGLGPLFKSSAPVPLTEAETEYVVTCIKHVFAQHLVFQFDCRNTLNDSLLERASVVMKMESSEDEDAVLLRQENVIPIERLVYDVPGSTYVVFRRPNGICPTATFSNSLHFIVKDCDPSTGEPDADEGYEDDYLLEDLDLVTADYVTPLFLSDFKKNWEELSPETEVVETYSLTTVPTIKAAVANLLQLLGMYACEHSAEVKEHATSHALYLSGIYVGGVKVLSRCRMVLTREGVTLEVAVRSGDPTISRKVADAVC